MPYFVDAYGGVKCLNESEIVEKTFLSAQEIQLKAAALQGRNVYFVAQDISTGRCVWNVGALACVASALGLHRQAQITYDPALNSVAARVDAPDATFVNVEEFPKPGLNYYSISDVTVLLLHMLTLAETASSELSPQFMQSAGAFRVKSLQNPRTTRFRRIEMPFSPSWAIWRCFPAPPWETFAQKEFEQC